MTNDNHEFAASMRTLVDAMPTGIKSITALHGVFAATLPAGTHPDTVKLLTRCFAAGASAAMSQVAEAMRLPSLATGDPAELFAAIDALGAGAALLLHDSTPTIHDALRIVNLDGAPIQ